jgi:4-hydroxy-tetrahydrodipicolinate synthase
VGRAAAARKPLEGVFPILQTPFTESDKLDTATLARQAQFLDKAGVHGIVWPQLASEYASLSPDERRAGAEALLEANRGLSPAFVLGVQGQDTAEAIQYARHAEKIGPDAIIALPPRGVKDPEQVAAYYKVIARECALPFFVQTIGDMSVEFMIRLAREVPTIRYVKDEAGETLPRINEYRARAKGVIDGVFTGAHGRTFLDELARGSSGTMPAASFADLYVQVWDHWRAGNRDQAMDLFSRSSLVINQVMAYGLASLKYLLQLRGVFPNHRCRQPGPKFDDAARQSLAESYRFLRKFLKA